ncbi:MAG: hypothetical protein HY718_04200 [Planctomycetes bacterium]|nr:hypothetical protein [Planctomycetota bacterium]
MGAETERRVGAKCRVCGQQLTVEEFRACSGMGHYCSSHLPAGRPRPSPTTRAPRPASGASSVSSGRSASSGSRRGRRISAAGAVEYSCKAQFARNGVIRSGRLTTDHPSCTDGEAVFVHNDVGYGPGEVATLFIRDPEGRRLAERVGFACHD